MTEQNDDHLLRRLWAVRNFDWFMDEVIYHKENHRWFRNKRVKVWTVGQEMGRVNVDEITG